MGNGLIYGYVPSLAVNVVGAVLFFIILCFQIVLGIYCQDWWMFVSWGVTGGLELTCYIGRSISHHYVHSLPMYEMQLVCSIIAPAFMAAGLYYQLGKQITVYGEKYSLMPPMIYTAIFTSADVISLVIQGVGGGIAAGNVDTPEGPGKGGWIMVGGIAFQVFILTIFIIFWTICNWKIFRDDPANWDPKFAANRQRPLFKYLFPAVCISILFLQIRSIYRIVELSVGWTGYLMRSERYFVVLDGLMIVLGMAPLCLVYPGVAYGYVPIRGLHYKADGVSPLERKRSPEFGDYESHEDYGDAYASPPTPASVDKA